MRGTSRTSLVEVTRRLDENVLASVSTTGSGIALGQELFQVVGLITAEHSLRRWLADPANPAEAKSGLTGRLLETKVSPSAVLVVGDVVSARWSSGRDLVDALERMAVYATVASLRSAAALDRLEDELFRFERIVSSQPRLRDALTREGVAPEHKTSLLEELLSGKADPATMVLVGEAVNRPRGRNLERALENYGRIVAERAKRYVAVVRSAVPLSEDQQSRLGAALTRAYGRDIHLNTEVAPEIVGGLSIQVGDEVIDGTIAGRIAEAQRRLAG
ncbi:F0F1 ATP synthase subunit delta [Nocardiopsis flavescens]|uniref:ATP synthase subunit delta n=1 Tax=Nocardiopsis flavescens TaxID=758803 RepID=A0A1M6K5V0_9ACTN|nr:F0F1 ATP synthase subunit delta [Nocardiopsis flavescens]SHJ54346.1 F-type H+-transporting ATPase subunit delta [Nocardiopsis flavescens]